MNDLIVLLCR